MSPTTEDDNLPTPLTHPRPSAWAGDRGVRSVGSTCPSPQTEGGSRSGAPGHYRARTAVSLPASEHSRLLEDKRPNWGAFLGLREFLS